MAAIKVIKDADTPLDTLKANKKAEVNAMVAKLIADVEWKEDRRLIDEQRLDVELTMTPEQISQERQDIRTSGDEIKAEIEALTTRQEVKDYVIEFKGDS